MSKILMKWEVNWADEMDISGFVIVTKEKVEEWKSKLKKLDYYFSLGIGTNEDIEYSDGKQLMEEVKIKEITDEEYVTIKKYFGESFGNTIFYDYDWDELEDWDDED